MTQAARYRSCCERVFRGRKMAIDWRSLRHRFEQSFCLFVAIVVFCFIGEGGFFCFVCLFVIVFCWRQDQRVGQERLGPVGRPQNTAKVQKHIHAHNLIN